MTAVRAGDIILPVKPGDPVRPRRDGVFLILYFILGLLVLSLCFASAFRGIQGDGAYYYSFTVSVLWDGDLDLKNQFDWPDPSAPQQTLTRGLYAIDERTNQAFASFNPGTGFLMLPGAALGRAVNKLMGKGHADPFEMFYQTYAASTTVVLSALTLVLLYSLLRKFVSRGVAACLPFVALLATNWLFYATTFAAWSHVYALFLCTALAWSFLLFREKPAFSSALVFGLAGGLFFSTRNFSVIFFLPLFGISACRLLKEDAKKRRRTGFALTAAIALSFLAGAAPQLALNIAAHGSPFRTGSNIIGTGEKIFGFPKTVLAKVFDPGNLDFLYSNLWNSDNGLFYCHLFFLCGVIGVLFWTHRDPALRVLASILLAGVYLFWFVDAGYWDNWFNRAAGSGFGQRRYLDLLPLFVFGAASLLEWSRGRRFLRPLVLLLFALLAAGGVSLTYFFQKEYPAYFAVRDSFADLYRFLLKPAAVLGFAAALFLLLLLCVRPRGEEARPRARSPLALALFVLLAVVPAFVFRPDPASQRTRFLAKRGFFLLYSATPLVKVSGRSWGVADNLTRPMLTPVSTIELPAPLEADDLLLFAYTAAPQDAEAGGFLEVLLGGDSIGRAALKPGKQVGRFVVPPAGGPGRILTLRLEGLSRPPAPLIFHEGRVVFKGTGAPPFGHVDIPHDASMLASGTAILRGWTLADEGVARVYAALDWGRDPDAAARTDDGRLVAEALFGEGERPDIERIFVLYPDIQRAAWRIFLDRKSLPPGSDRQTRIRIVSVANDGQETVLGLRRIIWRD